MAVAAASRENSDMGTNDDITAKRKKRKKGRGDGGSKNLRGVDCDKYLY